MKVFVGVVLSLALASSIHAQQLNNDERCQVLEGSNGIRVDQCDASKYLVCKDGRCQCSDPANQIYTYTLEAVNSRGKRSPGKKGGGFKKVAVGAVAGAATYHVASQATKGFSKGFTTTERPPKYRKVFSCYSRVGGQCKLDYNNWESVTSSTTTTTVAPSESTSEASSNVTTEATVNGTSTSTSTAAPTAAAQVDPAKLPKCVQYATCKMATPVSNSTSGFIQKVDFDPRVGMCECMSGYKRNNRDLCDKENGAGKTVGASMAVILTTLVVNRMFV